MSSIFQAGGALLYNSPTYTERQADIDALRTILNGEYLHVTAPRQYGKTSLLKHLKRILEKEGWHCAYVDLTNCMKCAKAAWYKNLGKELARQLTISQPDPQLADQIDLRTYLLDLLDPVPLLSEGEPRIALLLDEVEGAGIPRDERGEHFHEDFFMMLRALYNERDSYNGTFVIVLAGATDPKNLVKNPDISPFNVGQKISLDDFTFNEAKRLTMHLEELGIPVHEDVHQAIYHWTQGQPYLTERLCYELEVSAKQGIVTAITTENVAQMVERAFSNRLKQDSSIKHVAERLNTLSDSAKKLWSRLQKGESVSERECNDDILNELYLTGAIKLQDNVLVIRNHIYIMVFMNKVEAELPSKTDNVPPAESEVPMEAQQPPRSHHRKLHKKRLSMELPFDLSIELNVPPQGSAPDIIASIAIRCSSPVLGPVYGLLKNPFGPGEREKLRWYIEDYWKKSDEESAAKQGKEVEKLLPEIGKCLYKQIQQTADIHGVLLAWQMDQARQCQISIVGDIPVALNLPWELLHDEQGFLALRARNSVSIVRRLPRYELPAFSTPFIPPLRVLLVTARPKDVGFVDPRSIALELLDEVHNLIERGDIGAGDIELEFLRLPTLDALRRRLNSEPPIHVLHFDGHGTFNEKDKQGTLSFEDEDGLLYAVTSEEIAQVLQGSGVQLMVMTACKSAVGSLESAFSSVATRLIKGGVDAVVAMSASVLVASATRYAEEFYRALFANYSVPIAQGQARQALYSNRYRSLLRRRQKEGVRIELYDWWVPHYYQQRPLMLQPANRHSKKQQHPIPLPRLNKEMPPEPRYGFCGRSRELLQLERLLKQGKLVVVHGFCGVGKTAFVREAADWLTQTNMYAQAYFVSCERDANAILSDLASLGPIQEERWRSEKKSLLVIADSLENILPGGNHALDSEARTRLWNTLLNLADKRAGVVLTTSNLAFGDGRLEQGNKVRHMLLEGLRAEDAYLLASQVLTSLSINPKQMVYPELIELLAYLDHQPLAIQLVLPLLREAPLPKIRNDFVTLLTQCEDNAITEERQRSLTSSLESGPLRWLSEEEQTLLSRLTPFEGGTSKDSLLDVTGFSEAVWSALQGKLERVQLLVVERVQPESDILFLHFHPVLIPYLRSRLGASDETLREHYSLHYHKLAVDAYRKDKRDLQHVQALVRRELPNLKHALEVLLDSGKLDRASNMAMSICWFLKKFGRMWEHDLLQQRIAEVATTVQTQTNGTSNLDEH